MGRLDSFGASLAEIRVKLQASKATGTTLFLEAKVWRIHIRKGFRTQFYPLGKTKSAIAASNSKAIFIHRYNKRYNFFFVAGSCGWLSARCENDFRKKKLCEVGLVFPSVWPEWKKKKKKKKSILFQEISLFFITTEKPLYRNVLVIFLNLGVGWLWAWKICCFLVQSPQTLSKVGLHCFSLSVFPRITFASGLMILTL